MPRQARYMVFRLRKDGCGGGQLNRSMGDLGGLDSCARGNAQIRMTRGQDLTVLGTKKAGRFPIRMHEGPTKNLLPNEQKKRPARYEDTMVLAGISYSVAKTIISNLVGFHAFLLKYDWNELGAEIQCPWKSFSNW